MLIAVQETKAKLHIQLVTRRFPGPVILRYFTYIEMNYSLQTVVSQRLFWFIFSFPFLYESPLLL
jgi:hypothetical protein